MQDRPLPLIILDVQDAIVPEPAPDRPRRFFG